MTRWCLGGLWAAGACVLLLACSSGQDSAASDSGSGGRGPESSGGTASAGGGSSGSQGSGGTSTGGLGAGGVAGAGGTGAGATGGTAGSGTGSEAGAGGSELGGAGTGGAGGGSVLSLGMNDVTILAPLPENIEQPVLLLGSDSAADGTPFVPRDLFDRLDDEGSFKALNPDTYEHLHLIAVRFDLCDHNEAGPCPLTGDASLRLVFQPVREFGAEDVGFHAFYAIALAEVPAALGALVELSELHPGPAEPLAVSVPLSEGNAEYAQKLRAFVRAYGGESRLVRLTMNAQPVIFASITWLFRGVERKGSVFEDLLIVDTTETTQQVRLGGEAFFDVTPVSDSPEGLARAIDFVGFRDATSAEKQTALEALVAVDNPLKSAPDNVACVGCHTSSVALARRSEDMGVDPLSLPGRYETSFDVSITGGESATLDRTLRALGWLGTTPLISQRVANDTALLLEDLARLAE